MQNELNELLTKAKDLLKGEMTNISYETWIKNLEIEDFTNDKIVLIATSPFQKEAVETRYYDLVVNTFKFLTNKDWEKFNSSVSPNQLNFKVTVEINSDRNGERI